ncbi:hypothetical protein ACOSQ2_031267 [Xanthoceras sorbifolium]|uniref:Uncharacterized protein n=1 Tax=Xanthoceras sorbifolium TaxID=99658 RepID=A0ABQ8H1F9_9ROSI|nr:hypothetical protein JRO89_XS15G0095300 [Xanthoceras sorbifolium]
MDLKLKNIAWVGKNISQKFETICQEVENIVCQDTVKYVESQVQAVGESAKKFYSDVVQDFVPPSVDPVKHEAQEVVLKNASIGTYIKSMIGFEGNSVDTVNKQSHEKLDAVDPIKNQVVHAFNRLDLVNQLTAPISVDSDEGAESDLFSGQVDDVLTYKILDVGVEENANKEKSSTSEVMELISLDKKDSIEASSFCEFGDHNNQHACGFLAEVSPATSVHVVDCQSTQKLDTSCDNFASVSVSDASNTLAASEMALSVGSNSLSENSPENFPSEMDFHNAPVDNTGCVSDISDALTSSKLPLITSHKDKAAELVLINSSSVLSLESIGEDEYASTTNFTGSHIEISPSNNVDFRGSAHLDTLTTTSSNIGSSHDHHDIDYSGMETVELFNKVKLYDSCLMVDNSAPYAVPYRAQKSRSFKKRIRDAFTSRKRLTKEYEQLAIWFGDVYMGSSQDTLQSHGSSTISSTLDTNNLNLDQACDHEWELL